MPKLETELNMYLSREKMKKSKGKKERKRTMLIRTKPKNPKKRLRGEGHLVFTLTFPWVLGAGKQGEKHPMTNRST